MPKACVCSRPNGSPIEPRPIITRSACSSRASSTTVFTTSPTAIRIGDVSPAVSCVFSRLSRASSRTCSWSSRSRSSEGHWSKAAAFDPPSTGHSTHNQIDRVCTGERQDANRRVAAVADPIDVNASEFVAQDVIETPLKSIDPFARAVADQRSHALRRQFPRRRNDAEDGHLGVKPRRQRMNERNGLQALRREIERKQNVPDGLHAFPLTVITGQDAIETTRSATLPRKNFGNPRRP